MIVLPFHGCVLNPVLDTLIAGGRMELTTNTVGFDAATYTMAEILQRLRFCRGEVEIPRRLRTLCNLPTDIDPVADNLARFESADMVLLEPHTSLDFFFGPYALHRGKVLDSLLDLLRGVSKEVDDASNAWFYKGILGQDRQIGREAAAMLIPALTGRVEDVAMAQRILLEARGARQSFDDYVASIAELRDTVDMPIGMVTYVYQYLPDGRPMAWPADFLENTLEAAKRLNLPIFDSTALVRQYGVAASLDDSRQFYRPEFYSVAADAIFAFCRSVPAQRPGKKMTTPAPLAARPENLFGERRPFNSGAWEVVRAALATEAALDTAPVGLAAVKLVEELTPADAAAVDTHDVRRECSGSDAGGAYTMSFFACPAERVSLRLILGKHGLRNRAEAVFDLARGAATIADESNEGVSAIRAGMIPAADGWWWCWLSGEFGPAKKMAVELALCNGIAAADYRGDGRSGAWIAGPRLERGSQPVLDLNEAPPRDGNDATLADGDGKRGRYLNWLRR